MAIFQRNPGVRMFVPVRGATAAAQPELEGDVAEDRLISFAAGSVTGVLQERIVRSSVDDTLAFYYRLKELSGPGTVREIVLSDWPVTGGSLDGDYRLDGLGEIGPQQVGCDPGNIRFQFFFDRLERPVTPAALSRFMFIKIPPPEVTSPVIVTGYTTGGRITLGDISWSVILPSSFIPVTALR